MLQAAIQQEVEDDQQAHSGLVDESGRKLVVRDGFCRNGILSQSLHKPDGKYLRDNSPQTSQDKEQLKGEGLTGNALVT